MLANMDLVNVLQTCGNFQIKPKNMTFYVMLFVFAASLEVLPCDPFVRIFCFLGLTFFPRPFQLHCTKCTNDVGGCDAQRSAEAVQKGTPGTDVELGRGILMKAV